MNVKQYNKIFFIIVGIGLAIVISINIFFDIYRLVGISNWNRKYISANFRYLKEDYLKTHHQDFDAYIMGSSRANFYNARLASELLGYKYYSFATSAEHVDRIYEKLIWMKKQGFQIKQVILPLDYDFMFLTDDLPPDAIDTKEHPDVSGESWFSFYPPIFLKFDFNNWRKTIRDNFNKKKDLGYKFDVSTGHWYYIDRDAQIARSHEKYIKEKLDQKLPYVKGVGDRTRVNLDRLRKVIGFLKDEKIAYIVIINPYYSWTFQTFDLEAYKKWFSNVVKITGGVWNFSGLNTVTQNKYLYYDPSHFVWSVGDQVLRRIAEGTAVKPRSYNSFGDWVDGSDVESYVRTHFSQLPF
ncbi:MAG: hypothetical protein HQL25_02470 [Candidatus Omnitrophica bacterium]|nr:hypothetical protein [Candidatus Omnitrophota bacterium]